jgi:hypothetical protein
MTRTRAASCLAVASAALGVAGALVLPVAHADTLGNGLTVSCNPDSAEHATCIIGGCPRVGGDYAVDAVHIRDSSGNQNELDFKCMDGQTARAGFDRAVSAQGVSFGIQACRKVTVGSDKCTRFSSYTYFWPA